MDRVMQYKYVHKDFGLLFWVHLLLIFLAYMSPFFVDWILILAGVMLVRIQFWELGGCILTKWEMGGRSHKEFIYYYVKKIWPHVKHDTIENIFHRGIPLALVILSFIMQVVYTYVPVINI